MQGSYIFSLLLFMSLLGINNSKDQFEKTW